VTLTEFAATLRTVCPNVSHYDSVSEICPHIIYFETSRNYYYSDNRADRKTWKVDVHFFTHDEFDPILERLEDLFNDYNIPFDMDEVYYGRDKDGRESVIYYVFNCEV